MLIFAGAYNRYIITYIYTHTHPLDEFSSHGIVGTQKIEVMYIFGGSGSHFGLLTKFGKKLFDRWVAFFFPFLPRGIPFFRGQTWKRGRFLYHLGVSKIGVPQMDGL